MKIIDFDRKGNVVRFYLGADNLKDWYGDDWDDRPYECNAGTVYDEFISGYKDIAFPYNDLVLEPSDGTLNSPYCKDDMKNRDVPCIIVLPNYENSDDYGWDTSFAKWAASNRVKKYYFGDEMNPIE